MSLRLYSNPASPFAAKTRIVLREAGLAGAVEEVMVTVSPLDPGDAPLAANPLGKLPTLVRDDGPALYDSRVICRYLDDLGKGGLYPPPPRLWDALTLEATADGIMDAALLIVYEGRLRPPERQSEAVVEAQWAKATRALDALESRWMATLAGRFGIGHAAVAAALGYLDLRLSDRGWRSGRPALADWAASVATRESVAQSLPRAPA